MGPARFICRHIRAVLPQSFDARPAAQLRRSSGLAGYVELGTAGLVLNRLGQPAELLPANPGCRPLSAGARREGRLAYGSKEPPERRPHPGQNWPPHKPIPRCFPPNPVKHPIAFDRFAATVKGSTLECRILLSRRDLPGALGASPAASVLEGDAVLAQAAPKLQHRLPGRTGVEVVPLPLGEIGRLPFTSEGIGPIPIIVRGQSRLVTRRLPLVACASAGGRPHGRIDGRPVENVLLMPMSGDPEVSLALQEAVE